MSQPARLEERVSDLETEMAQVRFLATKAESEVSDMQAVLRGHTGVLNAIRADQVEQGKRLAVVEKKVDRVETKVDRVETKVDNVEKEVHAGFARTDEKFADVDANFARVDENFARIDENFARVDENFAKVDRRFALLQQGQEQITDLLTRHLGEPDEETCTGDADE